jgi:hypothetical protein
MTSRVTFAGEKIQTIVLNGNRETYYTKQSVLPTLPSNYFGAISQQLKMLYFSFQLYYSVILIEF